MYYDADKRVSQIEARNKVESIINGMNYGKDSEWVRNATRILRIKGPSLIEFTTCDLWKSLEELMIIPPSEPRAMAAVITKAKKNGWIKSTQNWRTSSRSVCHGRPVRVWRWVQ